MPDDNVRDLITQAIMENMMAESQVSNADREAAERAMSGGGEPPGFQGMPPPGDARISDRDAQIARNAAPPDFQGMPPMGSGQVSNRDRALAERAAMGVATDMPPARGANSPPLPPWVGRFAPPAYGRR